MKVITTLSATLIGSGLGISAFIDDPGQIDRTVPAAREGIVIVRVPAGAVTIEGWDRDEIRVTGTVTGEEDQFSLYSEHGHAEIRVRAGSGEDPTEARLTIRVPLASGLDVETGAADVNVDDVEGVVRMASGSGDLRIAGFPAGIVAQSQSGDIDVIAERSPGYAHSEDGQVTLRGGARDLVADRLDHRLRNRLRRIDRRVDRAGSRVTGARLESLGAQIGALVADIMEEVDVELDVQRHDGGFSFDFSGDVNIDPDEFEAMFEHLGEFFDDFSEELGESMDVIGDELGESMEVLGDELRELERNLEQHRTRRNRGR